MIAIVGELLCGGAAVGRRLLDPGGHLVLQRGDADLEELVEVRRGDRAELGALEQGDAGLGGEVEYALVERDPAQLTVDEAIVHTPTTLADFRPACEELCRARMGLRLLLGVGNARGPTRARSAHARHRGRRARGCGGTGGRRAAAARAGRAPGPETPRAPCGRPSRRIPPSAVTPARGRRCGRGPGEAARPQRCQSSERDYRAQECQPRLVGVPSCVRATARRPGGHAARCSGSGESQSGRWTIGRH